MVMVRVEYRVMIRITVKTRPRLGLDYIRIIFVRVIRAHRITDSYGYGCGFWLSIPITITSKHYRNSSNYIVEYLP